MKILLVLLALAAGLGAGPALAGIAPRERAPEAETASAAAVRTLLTKCLPGVAIAAEPVTAGLLPVAPDAERAILQARRGRVWSDPSARLLVIDFTDVPVCRVVALSVDPLDFQRAVARAFETAGGTFRRARYRADPDGTMAAVYTRPGVVIRISSGWRETGGSFASLSVELP